MCNSKDLDGKLSRRLKRGDYTSSLNRRPSRLGRQPLKTVLAFSPVCLLGCGAVASAISGVFGADASAVGVNGQVQLDAEVSTSIAMKVASPNDTDPTCQTQAGATYGTANRYSTSNGAEGSKQVDTFDGTTGGADEVNDNTSCTTLTMTPNTFSSTYSDVTVYTNSPNGYSLSLRSATGASPNLVNMDDDTVYIPAGALTENNNIVPGGQNKWAYKTDTNGNIDTWTAVTASDATIRAYDMETSGGSNTRVTYGISAGNDPAGRYGTTLTYTATMFDDYNPDVPTIDITGAGGTGTPTGATITGNAVRDNKLTVPYKATRTITITPDEGYYLTSFTCPEGFTCSTPTIGSPDNPVADARAPQNISITNNSAISAKNNRSQNPIASIFDGAQVSATGNANTMSIALDNKYRISFTKSNISSPSTSYVDVAYGGSTTVTVTPASGYYLSAFSGCPSGWSCTGVSTGTSKTSAQTLTLTNNSSVNTGTLTMTGTTSDPWAGCGTSAGSTCTVNGVTYIRLADGKLWTKSSQGSGTWGSVKSGQKCPSGTSMPSSSVFRTLVGKYSGGGLYNATGWSGYYWSSTEYGNNGGDYAFYLYVNSSNAGVANGSNKYYDKTNSNGVVCYR